MPSFTVDESIEINAPMAAVKESLLDFKRWPAWSPWLCCEPGCKVEYEADGQRYSWDGAIIGSGDMKILRTQDDAIFYKLRFFKPFKSQSKVDFAFVDLGEGRTRVHWRMQSSMPFFLFFMVKSTQAMVAGDYRRGLAKLKDYLETGSVPSHLEFPGVGKGVDTAYLGIRKVSTLAELAEESRQGFARLVRELEMRDLSPTGPWMTVSHSFDPVKDRLAYTMAIPIEAVLSEDLGLELVSERVTLAQSYKVVHKGPYRHLGNAWAAGMMHERAKRFAVSKGKDKIEVYLNNPQTAAPEELLTELHFPAR